MTIAHPSLDLKSVKIAPLSDGLKVDSFACGYHPIDNWVKKKAVKHHNLYRARVFCAHQIGSSTAIGLYSLTMNTEQADKLLESERKGLKKSEHFPVIYLQSVAVISRYQGQGLGKILLVNALRRAHLIAQNVAVFGVALRSANGRTTELYSKYGFGVREPDATNPVMVLPIWSLIDLIEKNA